MITRRDFLKGTGIGLGAIVLPSWLTFPEPTTNIQKYFEFLQCDGKVLHMVPGYDMYEVISYIWCANDKKPQVASRKGRESLRYYYGNAQISGIALAQGDGFPASRRDISSTFQKEIRKVRNEMEDLIKKELGDRNIWVFGTKVPHDLKLLKRI